MKNVYSNPIAQDISDVIDGYDTIFDDIKAAILEAEARCDRGPDH